MNALIIALAIVLGLILLLLLLILLGRAKIRIICQGKIRVIASIYGIRFTLYSDRPKKKRLVHRCDDPDKILARELRRQKRALKKKQKKLEKKLKKKQTKKEQKGYSTSEKSKVDHNCTPLRILSRSDGSDFQHVLKLRKDMGM